MNEDSIEVRDASDPDSKSSERDVPSIEIDSEESQICVEKKWLKIEGQNMIFPFKNTYLEVKNKEDQQMFVTFDVEKTYLPKIELWNRVKQDEFPNLDKSMSRTLFEKLDDTQFHNIKLITLYAEIPNQE
jgi:hypothetical protein